MGSEKTIVLKGHGVRYEAVANAGITPGHLVYLMSTGKVAVHGTASGWAEKAFAVEDDLQGKTIADAYASAALCQYNVMRPGEEVNAIIADGAAIAIGDKLVSGGDGTLAEMTSDAMEDSVIGVAMEAVDMSDSSGADPASARCRVRIV